MESCQSKQHQKWYKLITQESVLTLYKNIITMDAASDSPMIIPTMESNQQPATPDCNTHRVNLGPGELNAGPHLKIDHYPRKNP